MSTGLKAALAIDPDDPTLQAAVKAAEKAHGELLPTQVVHICELHAQPKDLEEQVKDGMAAVHKKGKYVESIKKTNFLKNCQRPRT